MLMGVSKSLGFPKVDPRKQFRQRLKVALKELREAEEAAWEKGQTNWVLSRAEAHEPLAEGDMLYRVVFFPLKTKLLKDRDAVLTKVGKRKIDNLIKTIHRQWCVRQPAVNASASVCARLECAQVRSRSACSMR